MPAAGVDDPHAGRDAPLENLIEEVDVDLAELFLDGNPSSLQKADGRLQPSATMSCPRDEELET